MSSMSYSTMIVFFFHFLHIGLCQNGVCVEDTNVLVRNLALRKPATQSSLYDNSQHNYPLGFAWRANDGNKNSNYGDGSCSHVAVILGNHWWQVDLQAKYSVTSVTIVNRNQHEYRLHDFGIEVSFSDQDDWNGHLEEANPCHYHTGAGIGRGEGRTFPCTAGAVGQYVRIYKPSDTDNADVLTLCEVEVSGYKLNCDVSSTSSPSTKDVTTQSSLVTTNEASLSSPTDTDVTTPLSMKTSEEMAISSVTTTDTTTTSSSIASDVMTKSSPSTTKSLMNSAASSDPTPCNCQCVNITAISMFELVERVEQLKKQLTVNKETTNSYQRKLISAPDNRMSATSIGVVLGAGVLVFVFGSIVVMDLPRLKQFLTTVCRK